MINSNWYSVYTKLEQCVKNFLFKHMHELLCPWELQRQKNGVQLWLLRKNQQEQAASEE